MKLWICGIFFLWSIIKIKIDCCMVKLFKDYLYLCRFLVWVGIVELFIGFLLYGFRFLRVLLGLWVFCVWVIVVNCYELIVKLILVLFLIMLLFFYVKIN